MGNMKNNNVKMRHLGSGVCVFEDAISLDWDWVFNTAQRLVDEDVADMYTPIEHPETGKPALINKSGYIFGEDMYSSMPDRCSSAHQRTNSDIEALLQFLEQSKDTYLLQYLARFPLAYKNIWWKVKGHIVRYKAQHQQYLGIHSDTSADYVYGYDQPSQQLATRNTLSCIVYLNDDFHGGHHVFDELAIRYSPQKGDILMFPSNFMASHKVEPVTRGERYSYLGWYSHGSPNGLYNEAVVDPIAEPELALRATNVYMPTLRDDFRQYLDLNDVDKNSLAYSLVREGF